MLGPKKIHFRNKQNKKNIIVTKLLTVAIDFHSRKKKYNGHQWGPKYYLLFLTIPSRYSTGLKIEIDILKNVCYLIVDGSH